MYVLNTPSQPNSEFRSARRQGLERQSPLSWFIPVLSFLASVFLTLLLTANTVYGQYVNDPKVFWTDRNAATLSMSDLGAGTTSILVPDTGGRLQDVDLDQASGVLYFSDWGQVGAADPNQGSIKSIPMGGGSITELCGSGQLGDAVHQLALDAANGHIYFTRAVSYAGQQIGRVNIGTGCTGLVSSADVGGGSGIGWFPSGLALDSSSDILYWGDAGLTVGAPGGAVNQMAASTLTSSLPPSVLSPHVEGRGRGFALDSNSGTLFLTSHSPVQGGQGSGGVVHSYDIGSGTLTQIIPATGVDPDTGYWDVEIDPQSQRIWYTATGVGEIRSAKFDGSDVRVELSEPGSSPYGLALSLTYDPYGVGSHDADVKIDIDVDNPAPVFGDHVEFTITASNMGPAPAHGVWVWFDTYDSQQCFEPLYIDGSPIAYGTHLPIKWGTDLDRPGGMNPSARTFTVKGKVTCDSPFWFTGNARILEISSPVDPDLSNNGPSVAEVHGAEADLDLMVQATNARLAILRVGEYLDVDTGVVSATSQTGSDIRLAGTIEDPKVEILNATGHAFAVEFGNLDLSTYPAPGTTSGQPLLPLSADGVVQFLNDTGSLLFNIGNPSLWSEDELVVEYVRLPFKRDMQTDFRVKLSNLGPNASRNIKVQIDLVDPHGCFEFTGAQPAHPLTPQPNPVNPYLAPIQGTITLLDQAGWAPLPAIWKLSLDAPEGEHGEYIDMEWVTITGKRVCGDAFTLKAKVIDDGTAHDPSHQGYVEGVWEGPGNADLQITKEVVSFDADKDRGVVEFVIKVKNLGPDPATWVQIKDLYDPNKMTFDRAYWNLDNEQFAFTPPTSDDLLNEEHIAIWKIDKILRGETRELRIKFFCDIKDDLVNTAMLLSLDQFDTNADNDMSVATVVKLDFGDAPAPYKTLLEDNGARHRLIPSGPMLGSVVDVDNDGVPSEEALGDDTLDGTDDEDGILSPDPIEVVAGTDQDFEIRYAAPDVPALLNIWFDFNDDGDWDDWGEHPIHNKVLGVTGRDMAGLPMTADSTITIPILPTSVNTKQTFMRLRICSNNMQCNAYIGMAEDGEVEDYQAAISSMDFGDADFAAQTVGTDAARHIITSLTLGAMIDSDPDGQPSPDADGDDTDGDFDGNGDDEDGITFLIKNAHGKDSFYKGAFNTLVANVGGNQGGYLSVFLDWEVDDVMFTTGAETVINDMWVNPGDNLVGFDLPNTGMVADSAFVRFRICAKPDECNVPTGKAKSGGEVEDYVVCLLEEGEDLIVKSDGQLGSVIEDNGDIIISNKDQDVLFQDVLTDIGRLTVMGTKADDYLFVDPDAIPVGTLMAMLGEGHNTIEIGTNEDLRDLVKHSFNDLLDGVVDFVDGSDTRFLQYSDVKVLIDNVKPADRVFAYNVGSDDIVLRDDDYWGDGYSFIDSDLAAELTFYGPTNSIRLMAGKGEDTIDFQGLDDLLGKDVPNNMFKDFNSVSLMGNDDADYILVTPIKKDLYTVNVEGDHPLMCYGDVLDIRDDWKGTIADLGLMNGGMGTVTFTPYSHFGDIPYTGIEALADFKADLSIATIVDPEWKMFYPGDAIEVTVKVTNLGHDMAQCVSVPDILDEALSVYAGGTPSVGMLADVAPRWFDSKTGSNDPDRDDWVINKLLPGDMASFTAKAVVNSQIVRNLDLQKVTSFTTDPELWNNAAELGEIKPTFAFPAKALAQSALFYKTNLGKVGPNMHLGSDVQLERMIVGLFQGTPGIDASVLCRIPDTTNPMTGELYYEGYDIVGLGNRWRPCDDGLPYPLVVTDLHRDPETDRVWLSSWGWNGLYYSDNGGLTWEKAHAQLGAGNGPWSSVYAITQDVDGFLYISANNGNVFRSMDKGDTWQQVSSLPGVSADTPWSLVSHPMEPGVIYAGTFGYGVFVSHDYGFTWNELTGNSFLLANKAGHIFDLEFDPDMSTLFAGTGKGIYRLDDPSPTSTDTWKFVNANVPNPHSTWVGRPEIRDLAFDMMGNLYAASWGQGVFVNTNPTQAWPPDFEQYTLREQQVSFLAVSTTGQVFANSASEGVVAFDMAASSTSTAIEDEIADEAVLPEGFELQQNYPNPFNPVTTIGFSIAESGSARLSVFDVLGREVSVLVDGHINAGQHQVTFDAAGLPTGTYIYRLETPGFAMTKQLILMK
jgi:uncharacterized repeat protein (TIGR01451 family)